MLNFKREKREKKYNFITFGISQSECMPLRLRGEQMRDVKGEEVEWRFLFGDKNNINFQSQTIFFSISRKCVCNNHPNDTLYSEEEDKSFFLAGGLKSHKIINET